MTPSTHEISVRNLYKIFGHYPKKAMKQLSAGDGKEEIFNKCGQTVALADVSFDVNKGETLVIMGLSGCGKSTLVRCINRLIEPTAGQILVEGTEILSLSNPEILKLRRHKFSMVFQKFALLPHRTVCGNVEYGLEIQGMEAKERKKKALETLELVGLSDWAGSGPAQLSGGMQQRVGLARALAVDPSILLMDEPFSALDPLNRKEMQEELCALQRRMHKTIVFISHDLDEALAIGDRIIIMKDGRIIQQGTPEQILSNPANNYVERFVENGDISKTKGGTP